MRKIMKVEDISETLETAKPGDRITLITNESEYLNIILSANPEDKEKPYIGVSLSQDSIPNEAFIEKYTKFGYNTLMFFGTLFFWLITLNLGIGLFNLLPLGIVDGGRMLDVALHKMLPKHHAEKVWKGISIFYLILIIGMILINFI